MTVRFYRPSDFADLERMHRDMGIDYPMPNLDDPLYFVKLVGEENGQIVNAAVAHLTAEIFFLADRKAGDPETRFEQFKKLHEAGCYVAREQGGLDDLHAWIPPQVARPFGRRLLGLGWKKPLWTSFAKDLRR